MSSIRQNFHQESEAGINKQINMELTASYVYLNMAMSMDHVDVALPGFYKFFKKASDEEKEHAEKFMKYQNKRGGSIVFQPINKPTKDLYTDPLEALEDALQLEKDVNEALMSLHKVAETHGDAQMMDFLEGEFLEEQVDAIKELGEMITRLKRVGPGLGTYQFDKDLE